MKRFLLLALALFTIHCSLFTLDASAQSRTNRIYRNCPGTTTKAAVAIDVAGNITVTPCSGKTTTVTGDAGLLKSYLATTATYNNTAALADTALSVTVAAGGIYDIDLVIHSTNSLSAGANFDFAGTSTQTNFIGQWRSGVAVPNDFDHGARITAAGTDYTDVSLNGGTLSGYYTFRGTVEVNAGGTFLLRSAQSSAVAENVSILRGSTLTLTKLN